MTAFNPDNDSTLEVAYANTPSYAVQLASTGRTVSFWLRMPVAPADTETIWVISIGQVVDGTGVDAQWSLHIRVSSAVNGNTNAYLRYVSAIQNGLTRNGWLKTTPIVAGVLYLVTFSTSGSAWSATINGVAQTITIETNSNNGQWPGNVGLTTSVMYYLGARYDIGSATNTSATKAFHMAQLVHWNKLLTAGEITELYNGGNGLPIRFHSALSQVQVAYELGGTEDYSNAAVVKPSVGSETLTTANLSNAANLVRV